MVGKRLLVAAGPVRPVLAGPAGEALAARDLLLRGQDRRGRRGRRRWYRPGGLQLLLRHLAPEAVEEQHPEAADEGGAERHQHRGEHVNGRKAADAVGDVLVLAEVV